MEHIKELVENKNVVFITTKNLDYIRNTQEINEIKKYAKSCECIGSGSKSYVKRMVKVYSKLLFKSFKKYDAVFVGFAPQLVVPFFKFKFKKPQLIIDFFISIYDTMAFDRKKFKPNSLMGKISKKIDMKTLKAADYIISDTKAHADYFVDELGAAPEKMRVEYLEADKEIFHPMGLEKPDKLKDKFVVLYFGSILPLQGVEVILKAAEILKDRDDLYFYIIGPMGDKCKKHEAANIEYIDWLSQPELAEYIDRADLCLAGHFNHKINKALRTIPGKAYIYEAMGKKMILGENSATHELYQPDDKHYFVEMGNPKKLAREICRIAENERG